MPPWKAKYTDFAIVCGSSLPRMTLSWCRMRSIVHAHMQFVQDTLRPGCLAPACQPSGATLIDQEAVYDCRYCGRLFATHCLRRSHESRVHGQRAPAKPPGPGDFSRHKHAVDGMPTATKLRKIVNAENICRFQSIYGLKKDHQTSWVQLATELSLRGQGTRIWEILQSWVGSSALHTRGCRLRRERGGLS